MNKIIFLILFVFTSIACGGPVSATLNSISVATDTISITQIPTEASTDVNMVVIADKLKIRTSPGGEVVQFAYLLRGDTVTVYERQTENGYQWCRTGLHWVGCEWLEEQ